MSDIHEQRAPAGVRKATRLLNVVIKITKHCNLRCSYCYEFEELHLKNHMSLEQLKRIYAAISDFFVRRDAADGELTRLRFIWHGGEPLLMRPSFYRETLRDQKDAVSNRLLLSNAVQTNLTFLDDDRLDLLKHHFDHVGVSIDLFGDLRHDTQYRPSDERTAKNMDILRTEGVPFGAITVLTRKTLERIHDIVRFYLDLEIPFRLLPLFQTNASGRYGDYSLSEDEIINGYKSIFDMWINDSSPTEISPLYRHIKGALRYLTDSQDVSIYNKRDWINTILINTDGNIYSDPDPYGDKAWAFGNIFAQPLSDILGSENSSRSALEAEKRMAANCMSCTYFGYCSGLPIAEESANAHRKNDRGIGICAVEREMIRYVAEKISRLGIVNGGTLDGTHARIVDLKNILNS